MFWRISLELKGTLGHCRLGQPLWCGVAIKLHYLTAHIVEYMTNILEEEEEGTDCLNYGYLLVLIFVSGLFLNLVFF